MSIWLNTEILLRIVLVPTGRTAGNVDDGTVKMLVVPIDDVVLVTVAI